ncbi:MAG: hypothetical protein FWG87_08290 [Defluviitaleaceae bacterium]|nr:hypothetical protein [Defluviitaleaceae bacterium]
MSLKRIIAAGMVAGMMAVTGCASNVPSRNQGNRNGQRVTDAVHRRNDSYTGTSRGFGNRTRGMWNTADRGTGTLWRPQNRIGTTFQYGNDVGQRGLIDNSGYETSRTEIAPRTGNRATRRAASRTTRGTARGTTNHAANRVNRGTTTRSNSVNRGTTNRTTATRNRNNNTRVGTNRTTVGNTVTGSVNGSVHNATNDMTRANTHAIPNHNTGSVTHGTRTSRGVNHSTNRATRRATTNRGVAGSTSRATHNSAAGMSRNNERNNAIGSTTRTSRTSRAGSVHQSGDRVINGVNERGFHNTPGYAQDSTHSMRNGAYGRFSNRTAPVFFNKAKTAPEQQQAPAPAPVPVTTPQGR